MTLAERLASARAELVGAGIDPADAAADVNIYAREVLGWSRADLLAEQRGQVPSSFEPRFSQLLARRLAHEPTAYILGRKDFWELTFRVTPAVLIPRPETEIVVEEALSLVRAHGAPRIADIGTGSGCLAITLAHSLPAASVVATDISQDALAVARQNAETHQVAHRVDFVQTMYLDALVGPFDLIVSNPPYIPLDERGNLPHDVQQEPHQALFGGSTGLRDIEGVLDAASAALAPNGWCVMEFGHDQEAAVRARIGSHSLLRLVRIRRDLQDLPRTAVLQRIAPSDT